MHGNYSYVCPPQPEGPIEVAARTQTLLLRLLRLARQRFRMSLALATPQNQELCFRTGHPTVHRRRTRSPIS
jgi:hypothetical protein